MTEQTDHEQGRAGAQAYEALTRGFGHDLEVAAEAHRRPGIGRSSGTPTFRLRRPSVAAAGIAAAVLGAVLVLGGVFQGGPTVLTPQQAVAAAARDLSSDGVLRWKTAYRTTRGDVSPGYDTWIDLRTGARHMRLLDDSVTKRGGRAPSQTWFDGRRARWAIWGPYRKGSPRRLVTHQIRRSGEAIPDFENPVQQLRDQLALGASGRAQVEDAGLIDGRPVAKVTQQARFGDEGPDDPDPKYTETTVTWITREATPRLVRTKTTHDGPHADTYTEETLAWEVRPRTPEALAHVLPPTFDPAKYVVRKQYLGPPRR